MKNKPRIKRKLVNWQVEDQGADPLTKRGRKWIKKEIKIVSKDPDKLRKQLESQRFHKSIESPYWRYLEARGYYNEDGYANPDLWEDDLNNTVD